ncbi:TPA: hypothetical protein ACGW3M_000917 [Pseudomonas aeruginosa]|nr:hypothetical protein [Pseudomonas aeruginosa]ELJ2276266.1 hypothetical protein [Pseudomonas aeruginosa]MBX6653663.1 hypothetical protein [Pseudomonas aeruginosa]
MRLYIEGHNALRGYAISREWSDKECAALPPATAEDMKPVRYTSNARHAKALVGRWNRRYATH